MARRLHVCLGSRAVLFLVRFVDTYSRYIVHHKLLMSLHGKSVAVDLEAALKISQCVKRRVAHDHGEELVRRAVLKTHNLINIKTKPQHPESNGIVERFNTAVRDETNSICGANYMQAEAITDTLMVYYNDKGSVRRRAT